MGAHDKNREHPFSLVPLHFFTISLLHLFFFTCSPSLLHYFTSSLVLLHSSFFTCSSSLLHSSFFTCPARQQQQYTNPHYCYPPAKSPYPQTPDVARTHQRCNPWSTS